MERSRLRRRDPICITYTHDCRSSRTASEPPKRETAGAAHFLAAETPHTQSAMRGDNYEIVLITLTGEAYKRKHTEYTSSKGQSREWPHTIACRGPHMPRSSTSYSLAAFRPKTASIAARCLYAHGGAWHTCDVLITIDSDQR